MDGPSLCGQSGALLSDALARAAHLAVQLHHLEDGLLAPAAQMVEQTVVLLGETVKHAEHVAWEANRDTRQGGSDLITGSIQFHFADC